ncbi:MAG: hypothetical protein M1840_007942 [Geoglossum simile]|nr:MAG: hypothetical protein M1840_007942 [Geoglossum simile]
MASDMASNMAPDMASLLQPAATAVDGRLPRRLKSREMDEYLKTLYPYAKTPQERMRECNIDLMKMASEMSCPENTEPTAVVEDDIFSDLMDLSIYTESSDDSSQYNMTMETFETLSPTNSLPHAAVPTTLGLGSTYAADCGFHRAVSCMDSSSSGMGSFENSPSSYGSPYSSAPLGPQAQGTYSISAGFNSSHPSPSTEDPQSSPECQPPSISPQQVSATMGTKPVAAPLVMVLNAKDMATVAQRTRVKYTLAKRKEVHETRKRGACEECRRRKKKCAHAAPMDSVFTPKRRAINSKPASQPQSSNNFIDGAPGDLSKPAPPRCATKVAPTTPQAPHIRRRGCESSPTFGAEVTHVDNLEGSPVEASQSPFPPESDFVLFPEEMDFMFSPHSVDMGQMWTEQSHVQRVCLADTAPTQEGLNTQATHSEHTRGSLSPADPWREFDEAIEALLTRPEYSQINPNTRSASGGSKIRYGLLQQRFDENAYNPFAPVRGEDSHEPPDGLTCSRHHVRFPELHSKCMAPLDLEKGDKPRNRVASSPEHSGEAVLRELGLLCNRSAPGYLDPPRWLRPGSSCRHDGDDLPDGHKENTRAQRRSPLGDKTYCNWLHCLQAFTGSTDLDFKIHYLVIIPDFKGGLILVPPEISIARAEHGQDTPTQCPVISLDLKGKCSFGAIDISFVEVTKWLWWARGCRLGVTQVSTGTRTGQYISTQGPVVFRTSAPATLQG